MALPRESGRNLSGGAASAGRSGGRAGRRSAGVVLGEVAHAVWLAAGLITGGCGSPFGTMAPHQPEVRFVDRAVDLGLGTTGRSYAAAAADFDRDGWVDLAVSTHGEVRLLRNVAGRYDDLSATVAFQPEDTHGLGWIDLNDDGWLDLYVTVGARRGFGEGANQAYMNRGGEALARWIGPPEVLADPHGRGRCPCAVDLDLDGVLDVVVMNVRQEGRWSRVARGLPGGGYEPGSERFGVQFVDSECMASFQLRPSEPPVLIAYGGGLDSGRAFQIDGGGTLVDVSREIGLEGVGGAVFGVASGDIDGDGDLDLFLARGHEVPAEIGDVDGGLGIRLVATQRGDTPLIRVRSDGTLDVDLMVGFSRTAKQVFLGAGRRNPGSVPFHVRPDDPSLDGEPVIDPDADLGVFMWRASRGLYSLKVVGDGARVRGISGIIRSSTPIEAVDPPAALVRPLRNVPNRLFENVDGRLVEITERAGVADPAHSARDAVFLDVDNDGDLDLFIVNGGLSFTNQPDVLFLNRGDGSFEDVTESAGVAGSATGRGATATVVDVDRDGGVDVLVTNGDGPPFGNEGRWTLWHNLTESRGNWVEVELEGAPGNRVAMGAVVTARFDGRTLAIQRGSTNGRFSTGVQPLHFGIGEAKTAQVEVRWPTGALQKARVRAGGRIVIQEPRSPAHDRRPPR